MRMRWTVQAVLVLAGIWWLPLGPAHAAPAALGPTRAAPAETGRYYVVGPPVDGQREYLYAIALRTLGNGNRYREIVQLNAGRVQPDGATFTDGLELKPGWLLVLPRDAKGQGVRVGPLPRTATRSAAPATPTRAAVRPAPTRTTAPTRPATTPAGVPSSARAPAPTRTTAEVVAGPRPERASPGGVDPLVIRVGAGVLSVLLVVVAIVLLRPGRFRSVRPLAGDDGPWPPERHHTPAPGDDSKPIAPASPPAPEDDGGTAYAGDGPSEATPAGPPPGPVAARPAASPEPPAAPRRSAALAEPLAEPGAEPVAVAEPDVPRPPLPTADAAPYLAADLDTEAGPARVRLVGVAAGRGAPPYAWLGPGEPAPPAVLPLVLGRSGPWRLHVDLARVPDVLTLVGPAAVCGRTAAFFARRLSAAGVGVAVVGEALGAEPPDGCRRLPGLPEPPGPGEAPLEPSVVFTAGLSTAAMAGARGLAAATGGRCVPVVLGPVPAGRWSLQLDVDEEPVARAVGSD
ncbi:hypothetical protein [Micromonospora okii]|uniref:hypothetical protein n=1 Tax=Micromonospora okii TaxID=1182970 RepID=UPI001E4F0314|nr:hypothetical protein [Micromonospora okii]